METEVLPFGGLEDKRNRQSWKPFEHTGFLPTAERERLSWTTALNFLLPLFSLYIANSAIARAT